MPAGVRFFKGVFVLFVLLFSTFFLRMPVVGVPDLYDVFFGVVLMFTVEIAEKSGGLFGLVWVVPVGGFDSWCLCDLGVGGEG